MLTISFWGADRGMSLHGSHAHTLSELDLNLLAQGVMLAALQFGIGWTPAVKLVAHPDLIRAEPSMPDNLLSIIGVALG